MVCIPSLSVGILNSASDCVPSKTSLNVISYSTASGLCDHDQIGELFLVGVLVKGFGTVGAVLSIKTT